MEKEFMNRDEIANGIEKRSFLLLPSGEEIPIRLDDPAEAGRVLDRIGDMELKAYVMSEEIKGQPKKEAKSIKAMQRLEMVGYEPSSDSGHFRIYPKGALIFDLLKDWAEEIALKRLGAMKIESPLIYNWKDPEIREQGGSFHERHYSVRVPDDKEREFVLRFAGDFGLFKIAKEMKMSHKILPVRIYELSHSFRYEKRGELAGLRRLRGFQMPDIHSFCKNIDEGWEEYQLLYRNYADLADGLESKYAVVFRIVDEFYKKHKQKIVELLRYSNRPAFIEVLSKMKHYWAVKHEFQAIDSVGGNCQVQSVQLDVKDSDVYGIRFVDSDGKKKGCIICHSSIGAVERLFYAVLEEALKNEKPMLPLWLSPAQLRIIPVSGRQAEYSKSLDFDGIRAEVDDSNASLAKKIARANMEWIPYFAVVGEREIQSGKLMVNRRSDGRKIEMQKEEISAEIKQKCRGMPFRQNYLPKLMSQRPIFHG